MCDCFECDPAWEGWERWYFGSDDLSADAQTHATAAEHHAPAAALPAPWRVCEPALH